jgi:hypothetical protein
MNINNEEQQINNCSPLHSQDDDGVSLLQSSGCGGTLGCSVGYGIRAFIFFATSKR